MSLAAIVQATVYGGRSGSGLTFDAPLRTSLALVKGTGSASFTRAGTATVVDWDGHILNCKSGEARFGGVRRVENLMLTSSATLTPSFNTYTLATVNSNNIVFPTNSNARAFSAGIVPVAGRTYVMSATVWMASGTGAFRFKCNSASGEIPVTTTKTRVAAVFTPSAVPVDTFSIQNSTDGAARTVYFEDLQIEDVTGFARPAPSEYVSVGVATGAEACVNPDLDSDTGWVLDTGVTVSGGKASWAGTETDSWAYLKQSTATQFIAGKTYVVEYEVSGYVAGQVMGYVAGGLGAARMASGVYKDTLVCGTNGIVGLRYQNIFQGSVEFVSIKEAGHGANVDGVKYFDYWNLNTVDGSYVVDESRGPGAKFGRRVENLLALCSVPAPSENFADAAAWVPVNCTVSAARAGGPFGRTYHDVDFAADANARLSTNTIQGQVGGRTYSLGFLMRVASGTANLRINFFGGANDYQEIVVDTTWRWFARQVPARVAGTYCSVNIRNSATNPSAKTVQIAAAMLEDTTAVAVKAFGGYVSTGVAAYPYPYSGNTGLLGVAEFSDTNPNTVNGTTWAVDEAGAVAYPITPGDGVLLEQSRTNSLSYSDLLTDASWNKGTGIGTPTLSTLTSVHPGRAYQALENTSTGTHEISHTSGVAGNVQQTVRVIFKPIGTLRSLRITVTGTTGGLRALFHPATMTAVDATYPTNATFTSATIKALPFGCYECTLTGTPDTASATLGVVFTGFCLSGTATSFYAGDAATGGIITCVQQEAGEFATSYIPTTTAAVARSADSLKYPVAGNVLNAEGSFLATHRALSAGPQIGNGRLVSSDDGVKTAIALSDASGWRVQAWDGTTSANGPVVPSFNVSRKYGTTWKQYQKPFTDGQLPSEMTQAYNGTYWTTNIVIGGLGSTQQMGFTKDVKIYKKALPDAKIQAMTL